MEMILPLREVTKSWSCEASILALALRPTGALPCGESLPLSEPLLFLSAVREVDQIIL